MSSGCQSTFVHVVKTAVVVLPVWQSALAETPLSPDEFTDVFSAAVERELPDHSVVRKSELHLEVYGGDGHQFTAYLNNAYEVYVLDPDRLDETIDVYLAGVLEAAAGDVEKVDGSRIVPIVKDRRWWEEAIKGLPAEQVDRVDYIREPLNAELVVFYAEDTETSIKYLTPEMIGETGINTDSLRKTSVGNLLAALPEIERHGADGLYMVVADGNYEASLLLVDELWTTEQFGVAGNIVVGVPARDVLLVTGTGEAQSLHRMKQLVKEAYRDSPYYISDKLFVRKAGEWVVYTE